MGKAVTIPESNFSGGIDARSAENQIRPGFVKDLLNGDVIEGRVRKRKGTQGYSGNLPVRVSEVEYLNTANQILFTLDESIDLSAVETSPLVVYGRTSNAITSGGPFTNAGDTAKYYSGFSIETRKVLLTGSNTLEVNNSEHGIDTTNMLVNVVASTSVTDRSHILVDTDAIQLSESTYDIDIDYTNATGSNINAYVYYLDCTAVAGSKYVTSLSHTGSGSEVFTIDAAIHALTNYNIIVRIQEDLGSEREFILPESTTVSSTTGSVGITINWTGAAKTFYAILVATDTTNYVTGTVNASSTGTLTLTNVDSPWTILSVYSSDTEIVPDAIAYDDATGDVTISVVNASGSALSVRVVYTYGVIRSNTLYVSDSTVTVDDSDTRPQLTLWGLDHSEIYGTGTLSAREGWVTHLDSFRNTEQSRLIAGLGGNIFRSLGYSETYIASSSEITADEYLYAKLYPRLQGRASSASYVTLSPTFHLTAATPARTRGYVTGGNVSSNLAAVTSVTYDSGTGWVKYILSLTSMAILDSAGASTTIGNVISTTSDLEDYITITQMSSTLLNGTFKIKQVTSGTNVLNIWVENSSITTTDWDDTGVGGFAGIFSDRVTTASASPFIPNDIVDFSAAASASLTLTTKSSSSTSTVVTGVTSTILLINGEVITGSRSSAVVPLRASLPSVTASSTNLVCGDMLSYVGIDRLLRVNSINPDSDRTVNITANGTTATVTLTSGDTTLLSTGSKILLLAAGTYTGVQTITSIPSTLTLTFATTSSSSASSATLVGSTMEVDETLDWEDLSSDANYFRVERRWIPLEAPDDSYGLTPSTYIRHLDSNEYSNQAFLRSGMVSGNMYLTNQVDEVMKVDGANISRAGLIPWQPGLFLSVDTSNSSKITVNNYSIADASISLPVGGSVLGDTFRVVSGLESGFVIGDRIRYTRDGINYDTDVLDVWSDTTPYGYIKVRRISGFPTSLSTDTLTKLANYKYYYRLNAIDVNGNIVASAITGSQDSTVELSADAAVRHKLVGLPAWDIYDYSRLDLDIYRTKQNEASPFYRVATQQMGFDNTQGYITYTDVFADIHLLEIDQTSILKQGNELGIGWSDPLPAKYMTTASNSLVLANIKDYPQLDIQVKALASTTSSTYAGKIWTFRNDSTDTDDVTDMVTTTRYEMVNGTTGDVTTAAVGSDEVTFTLSGSIAAIATTGDWIYLTYASANVVSNSKTVLEASWTSSSGLNANYTSHGFTEGQQVRLTTTNTLPTGLSLSTTYYIKYIDANNFKLATTLGGSAIAWTDDGTGDHTVTLQANDLTYSGWYQIESKTGSTVVINITGATATSSYPDKYVIATDPTDIPVLLGTDGNLGMVNGDSLDTFDAIRRLSMAINASMRMVDTSLSGMSTFVPWMVARGGNDVGVSGRLVVRQPKKMSTTLEVELPATISGFDVFVNSVRRSGGAEVSATSKEFPSRILVSYENYPEIFDSPTTIVDLDSDSAIDINPEDGQEITGVIPFFGESAFGSAQQSGIVVVFKENSVYLVDISEKRKGNTSIQRIETSGLGCTAPFSIAPTKNGIIFGNEAGLYRLNRNLTIDYVGRFLERNWLDEVNSEQLSLAQGHYYGLGRKYKVSVPLGEDTSTSEAYVYDHSQEGEQGIGAWSRYDNHNVTGWANLASSEFSASTAGRVLSTRKVGDSTDYRDSSEAIDFVLETRPLDFGDAGIRKSISSIVVHYRTGARNTGTTLSTAVDTERTYQASTNPILPVSNTGTYIAQDIVTVAHTPSKGKGAYMQTKIRNNSIDEDIEIAGIDYRVSGLSDKGIMDAAQSRTK